MGPPSVGEVPGKREFPVSSPFSPSCVSQNPKSQPQLNEKAGRNTERWVELYHLRLRIVQQRNLSCCSNRSRIAGGAGPSIDATAVVSAVRWPGFCIHR